MIAILPTGSGKSAAIFGPPLAESKGVTVVVTSYTALRRQLAQQATSFGIRHLVWSERNTSDSLDLASVRLVIMIIDDLSTSDALQLVPSVPFRSSGRCSPGPSLIRNTAVVRVVVDEAHSSFLSDEFRPKMQALAQLQQAGVPKVFLTATLAPNHEKVLAKYVGMDLTRALVLRSPTARPNHRIQVAKITAPHSPLAVAFQLASDLLQMWANDRAVRGIIFVRSLAKLETASGSSPFPICTYHGKMAEDVKDEQLDDWLSDGNDTKWMISTTALLHGVDCPRVDAVIFVESPFGLYDFVQGAGRAGRSGQDSLIAVLYDKPPPEMTVENPHSFRWEMGCVLVDRVCRRASISRVMDGEERSCSQVAGSLPCDFCEGHLGDLLTGAISGSPQIPIQTDRASGGFTPQPPPRPPSSTLLTGLTAQENANARKEHARSAKKAMELFGGCFVCRIRSSNHDACHDTCGGSGASGCKENRHIPYRCSSFEYKTGWIDWKKAHIKWPKDQSRCYFCGLPNSVTGASHKDGWPGKCKFSDTAITAAWHILNTPPLIKDLKVELGFQPEGDVNTSFALWLTKYESESKDIRLLSVFLWLCRRYFPDKACPSCPAFCCTGHKTR